MKKNEALFMIGMLALILAMIYGGWKAKRWWDYKYKYQNQVQDELVPLKKELADIRKRLATLELEQKEEK